MTREVILLNQRWTSDDKLMYRFFLYLDMYLFMIKYIVCFILMYFKVVNIINCILDIRMI